MVAGIAVRKLDVRDVRQNSIALEGGVMAAPPEWLREGRELLDAALDPDADYSTIPQWEAWIHRHRQRLMYLTQAAVDVHAWAEEGNKCVDEPFWRLRDALFAEEVV